MARLDCCPDAFSLVSVLQSEALRFIASLSRKHFQGLTAAGRILHFPGHLRKRLTALDHCFHVIRHITVVSSEGLLQQIGDALHAADAGAGFAAPTEIDYERQPLAPTFDDVVSNFDIASIANEFDVENIYEADFTCAHPERVDLAHPSGRPGPAFHNKWRTRNQRLRAFKSLYKASNALPAAAARAPTAAAAAKAPAAAPAAAAEGITPQSATCERTRFACDANDSGESVVHHGSKFSFLGDLTDED